MIGAHPDDENTSLLAYLALGRRVRTGYFSLTRGEGGQNVIGPEQGYLLGSASRNCLLPDGLMAPNNISRARSISDTRRLPKKLCASGIETA